MAYSHQHQHADRGTYLPGATAQCSLWFPPIEIPIGLGQTRSGRQLPVVTMITGYSRWLSAILIPSARAEDLFAGWWELTSELGAVPHNLTSPIEAAIGRWTDGRLQITSECSRFCRHVGAGIVVGRVGDPASTGLIEGAQAYLEHSFLPGRTFDSPQDFNIQLRDWLARDNARHRQPPSRAPAALIAADRDAMLPLPPIAPTTGWRLSIQVADHPFIHFDYNEYSVPPALIGHAVELVADLSHVRILCDGKVVAQHNRAWTRNRTIRDPAHRTMRPKNRTLYARHT
jgi:Mu transposase, C-terminal domain